MIVVVSWLTFVFAFQIYRKSALMWPRMKIRVEKEGRVYNLRRRNETPAKYPLRSRKTVHHEQPDRRPQPKQKMTKPKHARMPSQRKFLELNDHCLLEVFEFLPLADLCNIAETCVRLKDRAQYFFRLKHRDLNMKLLARNDQKITMPQVRSLFYNFGDLITTLHASRKEFVFDLPRYDSFKGQHKLLSLMSKYCSPNVLTLGHFWFTPRMIVDTIPCFKSLATLNFYRVSCFGPDEEHFCNFADLLQRIFRQHNLTNELPEIIQLV